MKDTIKAIADAVIEKGGSLLSWLWFSRYDETPQRLRVLDDALIEEFPSIFGRSREAGDRIKEAHLNATFKDTAPQKLCFYELILAITVRIGGAIRSFQFYPMVPIQVLAGRTTANVFLGIGEPHRTRLRPLRPKGTLAAAGPNLYDRRVRRH